MTTLALAQSHLAQGHRSAALAVANQLIGSLQAPGDLLALARFLTQARAYGGALAALERAYTPAATVPERVAINIEGALICRFLGRRAGAERRYRDALALDPSAAAAIKGLSEMDCDLVGAEIYQALARSEPNSEAASLAHFSFAKLFHDQGNIKSSWEHLQRANKIERSLNGYDFTLDRDLMYAIRYCFSDIELFDESISNLAPIFILGMPRTGTTLLERILSSHSEVECGGELTAMPEATALYSGNNVAETAAMLGGASGEALRKVYLQSAGSLGVSFTRRWTDKQCLNFLYCPLMLRAFPKASLIAIERHPMATVYAMYRTRFPGTYPFAYDLIEIADFFIARRMLMDHWRAVLPNRIITVKYEDLIEHFDSTVRWLLTVLKLPFDIRCLDFDRNPAPVLTMSAEAVRKPLYRSSLDTWRQYARELASARRRLEAAGIEC